MNFLKGSLFRRNTEPEELEPMEESGGGILAVWGSPGCGKTVTAVKIAKNLAAQKKNTVLLLCDMTAPMMPCMPSSMANRGTCSCRRLRPPPLRHWPRRCWS